MIRPSSTYASSLLVKLAVASAARRGVDIERLLADFKITADWLEDRDYHFPFSCFGELLNEASRRARDPDFGLHVGEDAAFGTLGLFDYHVASSASVRTSLERVIRSHRLLSNSHSLSLWVEGQLAHFRRRSNFELADEGQQEAELFVSIGVMRARHLFGSVWSPIEVRFRHPEPTQTTEHARLLGSRVRFNQPNDEIIFDAAVLSQPMPTADPHLDALLKGYLPESLDHIRDGFIEQVQAALIEQIRTESPSLMGLAKRLHLSPRTLQRRLKVEGRSYANVLDETRRNLSLKHVSDPGISIIEAVMLSGYDSVAGFYLAFRRWTGLSPAEFRRKRQLPSI